MTKVPCGLCGEMTPAHMTFTESEVSEGKVVGRKTYAVCPGCRSEMEEGRQAAELRRKRYARAVEEIQKTVVTSKGAKA